jgi:hypothetical protein
VATDNPLKAHDFEPQEAPRQHLGGWKPRWLWGSTLLMILGLIVLEMAGLVILYGLSIRNNGILTVTDDLHSLWKYGPTAGKYHTYDP